MITRDFTRKVLVKKLHQELVDWSPKVMGIMSPPDGTNFFQVILHEGLTPAEDIELHKLVMEGHIPSSSFFDEKDLTDTRNKEGFDEYKKIFAHISDVQPITNIDGFIAVSDALHKLRNFLKDGNFETAVRVMYTTIKPIMEDNTSVLYGLDFSLYQGWVKNLALKYNSNLALNCELINPAFVGSPFEGVPFIDYIELAPQGGV